VQVREIVQVLNEEATTEIEGFVQQMQKLREEEEKMDERMIELEVAMAIKANE